MCIQVKPTENSIKALDDFLAVAPSDHDKVPACHYRKAMYYMGVSQMDKFVKCFEAGLKAERIQLPCFLPYAFPAKGMLEKVYEITTNGPGGNIAQSFGIPNEPPKSSIYNLSLPKKLLIHQLNTCFIQRQQAQFDTQKTKIAMTAKNLPNTPKPPSLANLKKITLKDMDPTLDKTYDGYVLAARIISWPTIMVGTTFGIEDENGDVQRFEPFLDLVN